jgi:hypothetical protein
VNWGLGVAQTDLPDDVMADLLETPGADEAMWKRSLSICQKYFG